MNHTDHFVDPLTGVHTNNIERTWNGMKMHICRQHFNREFIDGALMEFIWRRRYAGDLWNRLLHAMHHIIWDNDGGNDENVDPSLKKRGAPILNLIHESKIVRTVNFPELIKAPSHIRTVRLIFSRQYHINCLSIQKHVQFHICIYFRY